MFLRCYYRDCNSCVRLMQCNECLNFICQNCFGGAGPRGVHEDEAGSYSCFGCYHGRYGTNDNGVVAPWTRNILFNTECRLAERLLHNDIAWMVLHTLENCKSAPFEHAFRAVSVPINARIEEMGGCRATPTSARIISRAYTNHFNSLPVNVCPRARRCIARRYIRAEFQEYERRFESTFATAAEIIRDAVTIAGGDARLQCCERLVRAHCGYLAPIDPIAC